MKDQLKLLLSSSLVRFLIVGGLGTIVNLISFYLMADMFDINYNIASVAAFGIAVTQNYFVNARWSFAKRKHGSQIYSYLAYVCGNAFGLAVNIAVLNTLLSLYHWQYKSIPQGIGIAVATILNYLWARFVIFVPKKPDGTTEKGASR